MINLNSATAVWNGPDHRLVIERGSFVSSFFQFSELTYDDHIIMQPLKKMVIEVILAIWQKL